MWKVDRRREGYDLKREREGEEERERESEREREGTCIHGWEKKGDIYWWRVLGMGELDSEWEEGRKNGHIIGENKEGALIDYDAWIIVNKKQTKRRVTDSIYPSSYTPDPPIVFVSLMAYLKMKTVEYMKIISIHRNMQKTTKCCFRPKRFYSIILQSQNVFRARHQTRTEIRLLWLSCTP